MKATASFISTRANGSAITLLLASALSACGGGGDGASTTAVARDLATAALASPHVIAHDERLKGRSYAEWEAAFWQWSLNIPVASALHHPFSDCEQRPISAGQTGDVWFWSAPDLADLKCDQQGTVIPAGTAIFLSMLGVEASSIDAVPFHGSTAAEQARIATSFADGISDLFCTIDGVEVKDLTTFRTLTRQFPISAPAPWIFGQNGGDGTAIGDGYFLMIAPLAAGAHTIHYGGTFHTPVGDLPKDITLTIKVSASP